MKQRHFVDGVYFFYKSTTAKRSIFSYIGNCKLDCVLVLEARVHVIEAT